MPERKEIRVHLMDSDLTLKAVNLWALDRCWPHIEKIGQTSSVGELTRISAEIVAAALSQDEGSPTISAEKVLRKTQVSEIATLQAAAVELLQISGLVPSAGDTGPSPQGDGALASSGERSSPDSQPEAYAAATQSESAAT